MADYKNSYSIFTIKKVIKTKYSVVHKAINCF
jgi:hypothetical protein